MARFVTRALVLSSFASLVALGSFAGCSAGAPATPAPQPVVQTGPTFHKDVEPILIAHCQQCHSPNNIAPFELVTFQSAHDFAPQMAAQTSQRLMPPWGAPKTAECAPPLPWKNDIQLSDAEIATIGAWSQAGAPEGDPKDAPPPRATTTPGLPGVQMELVPSTPFVTLGTEDEFRCFVLDPKITSTEYVNGVFFVPGNPKVVHHAVLYTDPNNDSAKLVDANGGYTCFGGPQVKNPSVIGVWAPGGVPIETPSNIGTLVTAGTKLVMQVHYHPGGTVADPDATKVQLRFAATKPEYLLVTTAIGNYPSPLADGFAGDGLLPGPDDRTPTPEFRIPANMKSHVERMQFTLPPTINGVATPAIWIYGVMPHMHLAGFDIKIDVARGSDTTCLIQDPNWRFSWQRFYAYDAPVEALPKLVPGDRIEVRCTYNNSTSNVQLENALGTQSNGAPRDIFLGEQTLDEMCLALPQLLVKNPF